MFIPVVDLAWFDDYYNQMLKDQPTPLDTFTQSSGTMQVNSSTSSTKGWRFPPHL